MKKERSKSQNRDGYLSSVNYAPHTPALDFLFASLSSSGPDERGISIFSRTARFKLTVRRLVL